MPCRIILTPVFLFLAWHLTATEPEYNHQVIRSFSTVNPVTVDIANKYGKVQVITWNNDSVKFVIDVRIRAKDASKLQKLKQNIDFDFTSGQHYIIARTRLGDAGSDVIKDLVDIANSYFSPVNAVTINYTVMIPAGSPIKIEDKFGNVYLDDLNGPLTLNLSYGDLTCNRLNARSEIRIVSGDAEINYLREGQIFMSYGNLHIRDAQNIVAETRSSNITIDKSTALKITSRRDKVFLNDLVSLSGESYFSQVNCSFLREEANFICQYGGLNLDFVRKGFSSINITGQYTNLSLVFERPPLFTFDLTQYPDLQLVYPRNLATLKTRVVNPGDKQFVTSGTFGSGKPESQVVISTTKHCRLTLAYK